MTPTMDTHDDKKPRRKHRVFLWVFLAVQAIFIIWLIVGLSSAAPNIHQDAVNYCTAHPSAFETLQQCVSSYGGGAKAGTAIGASLIVIFWVVVDFLLAVTYGIYRLARRPAR